jgi:hypothetical protein
MLTLRIFAQPLQIFRLLVIELPDPFCIGFAFSDHLPDLLGSGATLSLSGLCFSKSRVSSRVLSRALCRGFAQMTGCLVTGCPAHHDATPQPKNIHRLSIEYRYGIPLCGLHQLTVGLNNLAALRRKRSMMAGGGAAAGPAGGRTRLCRRSVRRGGGRGQA